MPMTYQEMIDGLTELTEDAEAVKRKMTTLKDKLKAQRVASQLHLALIGLKRVYYDYDFIVDNK